MQHSPLPIKDEAGTLPVLLWAMPNRSELMQVFIAVAWAALAFFALYPHPNEIVPVAGAVIVGVVGLKATVFLYVWIRYGWRAARSVRLYGNERE